MVEWAIQKSFSQKSGRLLQTSFVTLQYKDGTDARKKAENINYQKEVIFLVQRKIKSIVFGSLQRLESSRNLIFDCFQACQHGFQGAKSGQSAQVMIASSRESWRWWRWLGDDEMMFISRWYKKRKQMAKGLLMWKSKIDICRLKLFAWNVENDHFRKI